MTGIERRIALEPPAVAGPLAGGARAVVAGLVLGCLSLSSAQATDSPVGGDPALGAYLSSECVTCHQASGAQIGGVPAIVGWPPDQFVAVMNSYRDKHRDNPVMHNVASRLSDEEIAALAVYFGRLKAPTN